MRFPSPDDPGDAGWHVDVSFGFESPDFLDIARQLAPAGEDGLSLRELAANGFVETAHRPEALATGEAGTVYLCHPFLVHAAQPHRGTRPRFMAQPPLHPHPAAPVRLVRDDGDYSPVERAIRTALSSS